MSIKRKIVRQLPQMGGPEKAFDYQLVDELSSFTNSLNVTPVGNRIQLNRTDGDNIVTVPGDYTVGTLTGDNCRWTGSNSNVTSTATFDGMTWKIYGVNFLSTVTISDTCRCIFTNCGFADAVSVENGGKVTFCNCLFENDGYVTNAGAANNVGIFGQKTSTAAHSNVTVVWEI